jgi:hypothetical protein
MCRQRLWQVAENSFSRGQTPTNALFFTGVPSGFVGGPNPFFPRL